MTGHVLRVTTNPSTPVPTAGVLPGGGRLLAVNEQGLFAFGVGRAPRQLLGRIDAAAWSPHGRYAVAVRGIELIAVGMDGRRHWSFAERRSISWPAWSPSGYRIAYVVGGPGVGRTIHVVAGDGTGEHVLAATRAVPPCPAGCRATSSGWRPSTPPHAWRCVTPTAAASSGAPARPARRCGWHGPPTVGACWWASATASRS